MSNGKIKTYKNPDRDKPQAFIKPYIPQYQRLGVEPEEIKSAVVPINHVMAQPTADNPRIRKPSIRQPYAASQPSPVGKGSIPNVGNNVEHTWSWSSSVDGEIIDDLNNGQEIDPNHLMVDNNDYVSSEALGLPPDSEDLPSLDEVEFPSPKIFVSQTKELDRDETMQILEDMQEEAYLLIIDGVSVCSGPLEEIEEQARALVFGEHELCAGSPIPAEKLLVIKRVSIKIGLFLQ